MKKLIHSIFGYNTPPEVAKKIVPEEYFYSSEIMARLFNYKKDPKPRINYSPQSLEESMDENRRGKTRWILMCRMGLSYAMVKKYFPSIFSPSSLEYTNAKLLAKVCKPEYRLINLKLVDVGKPEVFGEWPKVDLQKTIARAHTCTAAEALIATYDLTGKYILSTGFHVGDLYEEEITVEIENEKEKKIKEERRLLLGDFKKEGMNLYSLPTELPKKFGIRNAGIITCRVPGT